jgi:hypothetical protein
MMEVIHKSNSRMYFPRNYVLAMFVSNLILQIWNNYTFLNFACPVSVNINTTLIGA